MARAVGTGYVWKPPTLAPDIRNRIALGVFLAEGKQPVRIVKVILMALGAVFVLGIAFLVWLSRTAAHFEAEEQTFAETFLADFSKRWEVSDVSSRAGSAFVQELQMPQGREWLNRASRLGHLKSIRAVRFGNYFASVNGQSGAYTFRALFENGEATVSITVYKDAQTPKVVGLFVTEGHINMEERAT